MITGYFYVPGQKVQTRCKIKILSAGNALSVGFSAKTAGCAVAYEQDFYLISHNLSKWRKA